MEKESISKASYVFMVWFFLILGIVLNCILSYSLITTGWNYYTFAWSSVACIMIGFGMGLAVSRSFHIEGLDKSNRRK